MTALERGTTRSARGMEMLGGGGRGQNAPVPVMLLSNTLSCRWVMLPSSGGSVPDSQFRETSRNVSAVRLDRHEGMLPLSLLLLCGVTHVARQCLSL